MLSPLRLEGSPNVQSVNKVFLKLALGTLEVCMQKVARDLDKKVEMLHGENQQLREILYRFGMSEHDIQLQLNGTKFMNTTWQESSRPPSTSLDHTVPSPAWGYVPNLDTKPGQQTSVSNQELYSRPDRGIIGPSTANSQH
ncbi:hypothetical protein FG05_11601 [Fusarium graminearum]|nr:hypothetical protein FG05_11601 [Fusarium graminearum]